jgi:hypothetical protein
LILLTVVVVKSKVHVQKVTLITDAAGFSRQ